MKTVKKIVAVLLVAVMAVASLAGCTKKTAGANSMFGITKQAMHVDKADFATSIVAEVKGVKATIELSGTTDGNATSVTAAVKFGAMTYKLDNIVVFTKDAVYFNLGVLVDQFAMYLAIAGLDKDKLSELGLDVKWVKFELTDMFEKDTTIAEMFLDDADVAYEELITKEGSVYTLSLDNKEKVTKFISLTKKMIEANSAEWAKAYAEYVSKIDLNKMFENVVKELTDAIVNANLGITKEQIDELKSMLEDKIDVEDALADLSESSIKEQIDKLAEQIKPDEIEIGDNMGSLVIKSQIDKETYITSMEIESEDNKVTIESKITPNKKASVEVPTDAGSFMDLIKPLYMFLINTSIRIPDIGGIEF